MSSGSGAVVVSIDNTAEAQAPIDNDDFADPNRISMKKVNGNPTVASASNGNQEPSNSNSNVNDETNTASSISSPSQPGSNEVAIDIGKRKEMDAKQLKEMIEQSTKQEYTGANSKDRFLKKDLENPFVYHDAGENSFLIRCYENFKYYLIGPFILIPIRFSLSLAVLIISVIITYIALVHSWFLKDGIESSKMQFYRSIIVFNLRVIYFIIGFYWVSVKGKPCSTKEARLAVIAPHQTAVDAFYIVYAYGFPAFVGKKEALHYPFLGTLMKLSGGVFFSREDRDAKDGAIEAIKKKASAGNDRHFLIFPTGTCTSPTCLICFKRGAFMPGEPLQPVLLRFKYTFFNPTWSSAGPNRLWMIYRLCCQFYNRLEVEFMPVYHPSAEEKANAFLYANNVRKLMADSLGVPTTEHSYDDMFLAKEARRLRVPVGQVLPFEFHEIKKLLEINLSDAKQLMRRFFSVKSFDHQTGKVSQEQFAKILGIPLTQPVIDIFNIFDDTGSGYIDFPSFLIGLAILRKNSLKSKETKAGDNMDTIKFIFDVIDRENKGVISKEQFVEMFGSFFAKYDRRKILEIFKDKKSINFDEFKSHMFQHPEFFLVTLNLASRSDKDDKNLKSSKRLSVLTR